MFPGMMYSQLTHQLTMTDDSTHSFNLPFAFPYFGVDYEWVGLSSNGVLTFLEREEELTDSYCCDGKNLNSGSSSELGNSIAFFWTDLDPGSSGTTATGTTIYKGKINGMRRPECAARNCLRVTLGALIMVPSQEEGSRLYLNGFGTTTSLPSSQWSLFSIPMGPLR
jgi:hypothetical protein